MDKRRWDLITKCDGKTEVDIDALDGEDREIFTMWLSGSLIFECQQGCYSTVEVNSLCAYSSDKCIVVYHHYDHAPYPYTFFSKCGSQMGKLKWEQKPGDFRYSVKVKCPNYGAIEWASPG